MKPVFEHAPLYGLRAAERFFSFFPERSLLGAAAYLTIGLAGIAPDTTSAGATVPQSFSSLANRTAPVIRVQANDEQREFIKAVQRQLQTLGLYRGAIDGIAGPGTQRAIADFSRLIGAKRMELDENYLTAIMLIAEDVVDEPDKISALFEDGNRVAVDIAASYQRAGQKERSNRDFEKAVKEFEKSLALKKVVFGEQHSEIAETLDLISYALWQAERYHEAAEIKIRQIEILENVWGETHSRTLYEKTQTTISLTSLLVEAERFQDAIEIAKSALLVREKEFGPLSVEVLNNKRHIAWILRKAGRHREAKTQYLHALEQILHTRGRFNKEAQNLITVYSYYLRSINNNNEALSILMPQIEFAANNEVDNRHRIVLLEEAAFNLVVLGSYDKAVSMFTSVVDLREATDQSSMSIARSRANLGRALSLQGDMNKAIDILRKTLKQRVDQYGQEHPDSLDNSESLATALVRGGFYKEATERYRDVLLVRRRIFGEDDPSTLETMTNLEISLARQGLFSESEVVAREVLSAKVRLLGAENESTLKAKNNLAALFGRTGRYSEAAAMLRDVLRIRERVLGEEHPDTLSSRNNLALTLNALGHHTQAEELLRKNLGIRERLLGSEHPDTLSSRHNLASAIRAQGRLVEAEELYRKTIAIRAGVLGDEHPSTLNTRNNLAIALRAQGRFLEAEAFYRENLAIRERTLGEDHIKTLSSRNNLSLAIYEQGRVKDALTTVEDNFGYLPDAFASRGRITLNLQRYLRWASVAGEVPSENLAARTFPAQGYLTYGTLDVALSAQAARRQLEDDAAAKVLRAFQDAREELQRLRRAYLASFEQGSGVTEEARGRIQAEMRAAHARFDEVGDRMERDFPALAELEFPRALEAKEAQALLAPGEGMLAYASTEKHLYVWLVTRDGIEWRRMDAPRADLAERVAHLRASLDIDWTAPPPEVAPGCKLVGGRSELADWPFDLCAAEEMQETLLSDLDLSGIEELIVVPDGPLESLPFAMLVTDRAEDGRPRWLIEDHAITTLPTTSSLRALRQGGNTPGADDRLPFLGLAPVEFNSASPDSALRGSPLAALPATDDEVRLVSGLLGAGRDGTVIGPDASEAFSKSAPLDRYRVLSFATHGLLSREAARVTDGDISEMSLALRPGDGEDGMLTASEVAGLRLDADWVLLSACNTAGGDGDDAEGLSGLARAFFFAGARTLMVSHWYIDDAATSQLMADTMERSVTDDAISRAQALRQAQLAMLSQSNFAHPFYWAPFSVVGDNR